MKLAIYTVLVGDKEPLGNPLVDLPAGASSDLEIDYICFTDDRTLTSPVWQFRYFDKALLPPEKLSRRPKCLPHEYLPDYDVSLYVDNTVTFVRLLNSADLATPHPYLLRVFRHPTRNNPRDEADAIALLGYEKTDTLCDQLDFYESIRPLESITPLSTCTVVLRHHHHPDVVRFGITWWEQILTFSKRDQLSFNFSAMESGAHVEHFKGFKHDNDWMRWIIPNDKPRIKANFDPVKYAWMHREDPEAIKNPRKHYLTSTNNEDGKYSKQNGLFEYICHKHGSSLGSRLSPRRNAAHTIEANLSSWRRVPGNMLIIRFESRNTDTGFDSDEGRLAALSLATYFPSQKIQLIELPNGGIQFINSALQDISIEFTIITFLGIQPEHIPLAIEHTISHLQPNNGAYIIISTGSVELKTMQHANNKTKNRKYQITSSTLQHDSLTDQITNGIIIVK